MECDWETCNQHGDHHVGRKKSFVTNFPFFVVRSSEVRCNEGEIKTERDIRVGN